MILSCIRSFFAALDSAELAHLSANAAAYALGMVDHHLAIVDGDSGTSDLQALLAAYALILIAVQCGLMLNIFEQSAGSS